MVFDFSNVAATAYKGSVSMLSAPTGHDQTVANTIDAPNLVTPKSSTASISVSGGVARGSIILPGWGAVVVVGFSALPLLASWSDQSMRFIRS